MYRYQLQFQQGIQNPESIKRWVMDRTVLLGNLDFSNLGKFWGLPAPVIHAIRLEKLLKLSTAPITPQLISKINDFKYPLYYY